MIRYGRKLIGATDPQKSEPGTIRGDLAVVVGRYIIVSCLVIYVWCVFSSEIIHLVCCLLGNGRNIIHGSDGPETAKDEISLWFKPEELVSYTNNAEKWIYGQN